MELAEFVRLLLITGFSLTIYQHSRLNVLLKVLQLDSDWPLVVLMMMMKNKWPTTFRQSPPTLYVSTFNDPYVQGLTPTYVWTHLHSENPGYCVSFQYLLPSGSWGLKRQRIFRFRLIGVNILTGQNNNYYIWDFITFHRITVLEHVLNLH